MNSNLLKSRAFSLVELLAVIAILAILAGASTKFFDSARSSGISTSTAQVGGALSMARDMAVAANRRVRFVIVTDSAENPSEWRLRKYGILQQNSLDPSSDDWQLSAPLMQLPTGVFFGKNEKSVAGSVTGGQMLDRTAVASLQGKNISYSYIEFLPSGGANNASGANIFAIMGRSSSDGQVINSQNAAYVGVAQHTGRVRIEKPE